MGFYKKSQRTFKSWCGHCKTLAPTWNKLSSEWNGKQNSNGKNVYVVKLNADENTPNKEYNVQGYPTILALTNNKSTECNCGRSYSELNNYISKYCI